MAEEEEQKNEEVEAPGDEAPKEPRADAPEPDGSGREAEQPSVDEEAAVGVEAEQPSVDEETPAEEPGAPADEPEASAEPEEAPAEEEAPAAEEAPAEADAPAAAPEEPGATPTPKQLRKAARSTASGPAGPQRSSEDRAEQRIAERKAKSVERRRYRQSKRAKKGEPGQGTPPAERVSTGPKVRQGVVISNKADKTITVRIEVARRHPVYEKVVRRSNTLRAHDEKNQAQEGDLVRIAETRPVSKTKRWRLVDVLERAK
jgi:small subunit ribosomal protein S17